MTVKKLYTLSAGSCDLDQSAVNRNLPPGKLVNMPVWFYLSYIRKAMCENDLYKNYTTQELIDELDVIERYEQPGKIHRIGEMTKKQTKLYIALGVSAPS